VRRKVLVAQRSQTCRICKELTAERIARVNAVIWPEPGVALRAPAYRIAAVRAAAAEGLTVEEKSVTRHARHIERSWHRVTLDKPTAPGEIPVYPTDYASITDQAAQLGAVAMGSIHKHIVEGTLESRELVSVAKMGVQATTQREALRIRQQEIATADNLLSALFGLGAGLLTEADVPEAEFIDVTPVEDMHAEVQAERAALIRLQAGATSGAG
jgi:hypothetical protein